MKNSKQCVVITTINPAKTNALSYFSKLKNFDLIISGDKKSPEKYDIDCVFLSISEQKKYFPKFYNLIPFNHYSRKNFGYLYAIKNGYDFIGESDDDNYPYSQWFDGFVKKGTFNTIYSPKYPNIYSLFTKRHIWPRGFPLDKIMSKEAIKIKKTKSKVLVWQGLVDGDTDVDAIYRMVLGDNIKFQKNKSIVLNKGVLSPFNSQNTLWQKEGQYLLYLPITVSFRFTDILRSFVCQFGLWALGGRLGFISPNAIQRRNAHNLMRDFKDEVEMHNLFYSVMNTLKGCHLTGEPTDLIEMYSALYKSKIVQKYELRAVEQWIKLYGSLRK